MAREARCGSSGGHWRSSPLILRRVFGGFYSPFIGLMEASWGFQELPSHTRCGDSEGRCALRRSMTRESTRSEGFDRCYRLALPN